MRRFDIVVVGGGPAGTTAAYLLARKGFEVCLIDKRVFPRAKLCAGLLTWKTTRLVEQLYDTSVNRLKRDGIIHHACRNYRIFFNNSKLVNGKLDYPFHFTDREAYDNYWMSKARAAGATIMAPFRVARVDHETGLLDISGGGRIRAELIIGADGIGSKVRNAIVTNGRSRRRWRFNLAASLEAHLPYDSRQPRSDCADLYFGLVPWGYAWSFPGATQRTIGICSLTRRHPRSIRTTFEKLAAQLHIDMATLTNICSYPLPYGNYMQRPADKRVLLTGDACGLADPLLGEGIYYAHRSAQIAAQAIVDCYPLYHEVAGAYSRRLNAIIIKEFRWINMIRNALFMGAERRRFRGLKLLMHLMPKRLEATVHGRRLFSRLWVP